MSDIERSAFTVTEIAQRVGVSRAHVYRAIDAGHLKVVRLAGGKRPLIRVTPQAEAEWLTRGAQ